MALYVIQAVSLDASGNVESVEWGEADAATHDFKEPPSEAPVEHVVFALERGDEVRVVFVTPTGRMDGGPVRAQAGASNRIELTQGPDGRTLQDLAGIGHAGVPRAY